MKSFVKEFLKRGFISAWGGPFILSIIYYINYEIGRVESVPLDEVAIGIFSITLMAFIAGGITAIYQNEILPLGFSIIIHAAVLYLDYLMIYLLNSWIPKNATALTVFTVFFVTGFALIWFIIYLCNKKKIDGINSLRSEKIQ